jgi:hypothetical protein
MKKLLYILLLSVIAIPSLVFGAAGVADVDSITVSTSATTTCYTYATLWSECAMVARGGTVYYKIASTIADTTNWTSQPWGYLLQNESISFSKAYNPTFIGIRAIKYKTGSGTAALIITGTKSSL